MRVFDTVILALVYKGGLSLTRPPPNAGLVGGFSAGSCRDHKPLRALRITYDGTCASLFGRSASRRRTGTRGSDWIFGRMFSHLTVYQNAQLAARFLLLEQTWAAEITYRVLAVLFMSSIGIPSPTRVARHP